MKFLITVLFFIVNSQLNDKLIFVMTHFRHGARAPSALKNNIDEIGEKWLISGELTAVGERMHYLLGLRNRIRYINEKKFLSEKLDSKELAVISTNVERTIASLSSHLQGLYPQNEKLGKTLTNIQLKTSDPPVELNDSRIIQEKNELDNSALPDYMTIIPFTTMSLEGSYNFVLNLNYSGVKSLENEVNEKYKENFDQLKKKNNNTSNYTFYDCNMVCDSFVTNYADGRNMSNFKNTNINFEEFYDFCKRVLTETFAEVIPQNNKTLSYIQGSPSMKLLVNYAKLRVDEDIENSTLNNTINKSSSKKMLIVSGHDSTLSTQQLFIINSFGKDLEFYRYPTFASQLAFEITRKDDNKTKRDYSDYFINYYFNDELLLNMTLSEFLNKIEPNIPTNDDNSNGNNNNYNNITQENNTSVDSNNTENNNENVVVIKKNNYRNAPLIVFACLFGVSLLVNIFLIYKLLSKNSGKEIPNQTITSMKI